MQSKEGQVVSDLHCIHVYWLLTKQFNVCSLF